LESLNLGDHYLQLDDDQKPYYILLAGDPEAIPFRFQYNLDVAAAVGRVFFKNLDDYAQYAKKVVDFETGKDAFVANRAVFFATEHPWQDDVTHISRRYMTNPLVDMVTKMGVQVSYFAGDEATLTNLMSNFGDASTEAPALIFTASHGVAVLDDDEDLRRCLQGALICQDYDGLSGVLAAEQVPTDSFGHGSIVFSFACYGAGTPRQSDFFQWIKYPRLLRCRPAQDFIAALPQKLLQHPQGPLAFIGHIDPAWLYSFAPPTSLTRIIHEGDSGATFEGL
jgi:hypothetical protein